MNDVVSFEDFKKINIKIAKILSVEEHPDAERLYVLKIDIGEEQPCQIVAGIKTAYEKEELVGKKILVVANLQPAVIRGVESNGMLLAARVDDKPVVISPDKDIPVGIMLG
jgi:methionyl-tRNA synthetase